MVWVGWLAVCIVTIWVGVAWPLTGRLLCCLLLAAFNLAAVRTCVLLAGPGAVRELSWQADGRLEVGLGSNRRIDATLGTASFRLGTHLLVLWFETGSGARVVLIDAGSQDPGSFRRLCRRLAGGELLPSRPKV